MKRPMGQVQVPEGTMRRQWVVVSGGHLMQEPVVESDVQEGRLHALAQDGKAPQGGGHRCVAQQPVVNSGAL